MYEKTKLGDIDSCNPSGCGIGFYKLYILSINTNTEAGNNSKPGCPVWL